MCGVRNLCSIVFFVSCEKMTKDEEIRMINEKLDFYVMEASDEEFDTEEVRKLVKRLDELDPIPLPWKSDEEALKDFWDYCEERQREERIIAEISNVGNREYEIKMGDKVGQLVIMPILIPDFTFENWKERGNGAFGSTGR